MSRKYRVAVADADVNALTALQGCLVRAGHQVVAAASRPDQFARDCASCKPDLVISDAQLSSGEALATISTIGRELNIPIIVTSETIDENLVDQTAECQVFGLLAKPVRESELVAMIAVAARRFEEFQELRNETTTLRKALDDRRVIEQAKDLLMKKCSLDEDGAFRHLQHLARQHRQKLVDVAKSVLIAESAFSHAGDAPIS